MFILVMMTDMCEGKLAPPRYKFYNRTRQYKWVDEPEKATTWSTHQGVEHFIQREKAISKEFYSREPYKGILERGAKRAAEVGSVGGTFIAEIAISVK